MGLFGEPPERGLDLGERAGLRDPEHLVGALAGELLAAGVPGAQQPPPAAGLRVASAPGKQSKGLGEEGLKALELSRSKHHCGQKSASEKIEYAERDHREGRNCEWD